MVTHICSLSGLTVSIDVDYTPPPDFVGGPNEYRAASTVFLTCQVVGGGWTYQWSSTCTGPSRNCFVPGKATETITRIVLRSTDSGNHTCTAARGIGTGSATIGMNVVGEYVYMDESIGCSSTHIPPQKDANIPETSFRTI